MLVKLIDSQKCAIELNKKKISTYHLNPIFSLHVTVNTTKFCFLLNQLYDLVFFSHFWLYDLVFFFLIFGCFQKKRKKNCMT